MTQAAAPVVPHQRHVHEPVGVALKPRLEASWGVFCGAVASGALTPEVSALVRLLAGWFLADIIIGFALAQLLAAIRVAVSLGAPPEAGEQSGARIPYAQPGSPGDRLARAVGRWTDHWRARLGPAMGHHLASFVTASAMAFLVGAYLGGWALAASAATIALAGTLAIVCGARTDALARWYAGIALGAAWYLGHRLFAAVPPVSWGVAALVGLAAYGRVLYAGEGLMSHRHAQRGRRLVGYVWAALVVMMLAARQPIAAGITAIAGLVEAMASRAGARRAPRLGWLAAMLLAALIAARAA